MTTATLRRPAANPALLILLAAVVILAALAVTQAIPNPHALEAHGIVQAVSAANCFNGGGTVNPHVVTGLDRGREAHTCIMGGYMFVWITDRDGQTVTMYRNRCKSFEDVEAWLVRRGH